MRARDLASLPECPVNADLVEAIRTVLPQPRFLTDNELALVRAANEDDVIITDAA